ncbi:hypothetical protein PR048_008545 [Dryococelus australis]|uniref:Uncharacterized protein n=1 Tax=Dryococelus australis TaxID=614101 RepID=A0ABQ9HXE7_9NEOP|nr:hypothetical protein PR048_008545 [Dryococelus australis]
MICFLLVVFSLLYLATCPHTDTYNVGTALFREPDITKKFWTKEAMAALQELALLDARCTMQDLIPAKPMDTQTDAYISELTAYFRKSAEITQKSTEGRVRTLMLMALYDVIGGYLRAYALPVSRLAYYAGTVRYHHVEVLNNVYNQIKTCLRTDGSTWSSDMGLRRIKPAISTLKISPLRPEESKDACRHFDLHEESGM